MTAPAVDIRAARLNRGLSVEDAARAMQVTTETLRRAELGHHRPQARNAFRIADFYGLQVTDVWPIEEAAA